MDRSNDAAGWAAGPAEDAPGFQQCEGAFARCSESGVVSVVLLVVRGLDAVAVVGSADGGTVALVGPVGQNEDLPGEADLDDAAGAGQGQVVGASGQCTGEPQGCAVRRAMTCTFIPRYCREGKTDAGDAFVIADEVGIRRDRRLMRSADEALWAGDPQPSAAPTSSATAPGPSIACAPHWQESLAAMAPA